MCGGELYKRGRGEKRGVTEKETERGEIGEWRIEEREAEGNRSSSTPESRERVSKIEPSHYFSSPFSLICIDFFGVSVYIFFLLEVKGIRWPIDSEWVVFNGLTGELRGNWMGGRGRR